MGKFIMTEEYSFGPWILKISEKYPTPKLFEPYFDRNSNSLLAVKIPRDLERQQIKGIEDLYDYVIAIYEDYIQIFKRAGKEVEQMKVLYSEIECVENFVDLLDGRFTLYLRDKKIEIKYNSVSEDIIQEILYLIRKKYAKEWEYKAMEENLSLDDKNQNARRMDDVYRTLFNQLKQEGSTPDIIAMQPNYRMRNTSTNKVKQVFQMILNKKFLSSMHLLNRKELIIVSRGKILKNFREAVYSYSYIFIPLENIQEVVKESISEYKDTNRIGIRTKNNIFHSYFNGDNLYIENILKLTKKLERPAL